MFVEKIEIPSTKLFELENEIANFLLDKLESEQITRIDNSNVSPYSVRSLCDKNYKNMTELQKQKLEMWKKKLAEANTYLGEALKRKSEAMKVGYLSENAYKVAIEEIEISHARIKEINRIINNLETNKEDK